MAGATEIQNQAEVDSQYVLLALIATCIFLRRHDMLQAQATGNSCSKVCSIRCDSSAGSG